MYSRECSMQAHAKNRRQNTAVVRILSLADEEPTLRELSLKELYYHDFAIA